MSLRPVPRLAAGGSLTLLLCGLATTGAAQASTRAPLQPAGPGPNLRVAQSLSTNWSGYAATGRRFTSVTASWVQPTAHCAARNTFSSFWVGLDGDGSRTVEQTGTEADCRNGRAVYGAWFEMFPKFPVFFRDPVRPGDHISASVTGTPAGAFTLKITNATARWSHTVRAHSARARLASAEVIAEAPSSRAGVLPLTNFGVVRFTGARANGAAIGSFRPDRITMVTPGGGVKARPTAISGGTNFSVVWRHS